MITLLLTVQMHARNVVRVISVYTRQEVYIWVHFRLPKNFVLHMTIMSIKDNILYVTGLPPPSKGLWHLAGVLLEAGTRVLAPVYSEHSTRLRRNRSQVDKYEIKSQTNRNFFSLLSRLARGV